MSNVTVWDKEDCGTCSDVIQLLQDSNIEYNAVPVTRMISSTNGRDVVKQFIKQKKVSPVIRVGEDFVHPNDLPEKIKELIDARS